LSGSKSGTRVAVAILLIAAAGPAGFFTYRFLAARHLIARPADRAPVGSVSAPGAASASPAASAIAPRPPDALPEITLPDTDGIPRKLSGWHGHPLIVNFWATWCEPCRREIPLLESLRRAAQSAPGDPADRLEVIGIAVDDRDAVLPYVRRMSVDYPVLIGGADRGAAAMEALGLQAVLPVSVFADRQGRVVGVKIGELHPDDARLILARLADVDAGKMPLRQARDQISSGLAALAAARAKAAQFAPSSPSAARSSPSKPTSHTALDTPTAAK